MKASSARLGCALVILVVFDLAVERRARVWRVEIDAENN
jgi:hypothetical protein